MSAEQIIITLLVPAIVALYGANIWLFRTQLSDKDRANAKLEARCEKYEERLSAQTELNADVVRTLSAVTDRFFAALESRDDRQPAGRRGASSRERSP